MKKLQLEALSLEVPELSLEMCKRLMGGGYALELGDYRETERDGYNEIIDGGITITPDEQQQAAMDERASIEEEQRQQQQEQQQDEKEGQDNGRSDTDRPEDRPKEEDGYNVNDAVGHLRENAHGSSQGECARHVREALEAGGMDTTGRPVSAGDYDSFLPSLGFNPVDSNNYTPEAGDIVVHEGREGHEHGHIAMYDGSDWISDFVQRDMFGGSAYRQDPDYTIWRRN
ncbi:MAG: hypothetical protein LBK47_01170 [Prevotellaceae bacterium]|jgi:hypothetical protein|nr:hypothetical protein [Prevotellaceae bacterium]